MVSYPNMASIRQRCSNRICSFGSARPKADDRLRLGDAHGLLFLRVGHTIRHRYRRRCVTDGRSWHVGRTTLSLS